MKKNEKSWAGAMRIFEALSGVDGALLEKSEGAVPVRKRRGYLGSHPMKGTLAAAACVVVVGFALWQLGAPLLMQKGMADCAAGETAENDAADDTVGWLADEETWDGGGKPSESQGLAAESEEHTQEEGLKGNTPVISDITEARNVPVLGNYIPDFIPAEYVWEWGTLEEAVDGSEILTVCWSIGPENMMLRIVETETGLSMEYEADIEGYVFEKDELTKELIAACMRVNGDRGIPYGEFAVSYEEGVVVHFLGNGTISQIWEMFGSIDVEE